MEIQTFEKDGTDGGRAEWMQEEAFGVMVHWLFPGVMPERGEPERDFNRAVEAFQVEEFVRQVVETGANWLIFTLGQNSGYYVSPNGVLEQLAGPGHCSRRDLAREIAVELKRRGKRFVAYLPAEVHMQKEEIQRAFGWDMSDPTQQIFQKRYTEFVREYAVTFGDLLSGWWFDGCYSWKYFPNRYYNWPLWAEAARAGNGQAALAFNDGTFVEPGHLEPLTSEQDYMAGEAEVLYGGKIVIGRRSNGAREPLFLPESMYVPSSRCLWHVLPYIDAEWIHQVAGPMESLLYEDENLFSCVRSVKAVGGAVTLNIGVYEDGGLGDAARGQLERLAQFLAKGV